MGKIFLYNFFYSIFLNKQWACVYIYNKNYFFFIKISKKSKLLLKNNNCIEVQNTKGFGNSTLTKPINNFIKQFYFYEFSKIKFSGKGYKIKKNSKQSMILLFNRAHITILWWRNLFLKKNKKYKMYIKYNNIQSKILNSLIAIRPINCFTKKGLRLSRQIFLKKKGKK